jgi:long-chain acyl-CoA synthetase
MPNLARLLLDYGDQPERVLYRQHVDGAWRDFTAREVIELAAAWQSAFRREAFQRGDRIAICARNSVAWVAVDMAALGLGLVVVPLYVDDNAGNVVYCLNDCGARLLVLETPRLLAELRKAAQALPPAVCLSVEPGQAATSAEAWLPAAREPLSALDLPEETLATLCYTSGTSGRPKGVMLTHANLLANARASLSTIRLQPDELFISLLPLSHMFERTAGYYLALMHGAKVVFSRGVAQFADDLASERPTAMITVPRVLERFQARIQQSVAKNPFKRWLLRRAIASGWRRANRRERLRDILFGGLLDRAVAGPVRERLGGRLYLAVAGGAALDPEIARSFIGLGITVLQGYGLTEASPVVSVNRIEDNVPESVGRPLPGVETATTDEGELLVRGPNVMQGYWGKPEATAAALDPDGWLHTGDVVQIRDGRLYIRGRLKDILVLSNGEKFPPADVEMAISHNPAFQQVMLVGEGRPFLTLLAVTDEQDEKKLIKIANQQVSAFPRYVRVRRVIPVRDPWTVDNGLLTPTLKLRRREVLARYARQIEEVYAPRGID